MNSAFQKNCPVAWSFTANTPDELAKIGDALFTATKQKFLDEQVQMTRLLESLATDAIFRFPVRVGHTGENGVPDFQLECDGHRIGVEISKVAVRDVEHARGLQRKGLKPTLAISSLNRRLSQPRTKDAVIAEAFLTPSMVFPVSVAEHDAIWLEAATAELDDKTSVLRQDHFTHGSEDWLVLWDRIGTPEGRIDSRIESLFGVLASRWNPGWYSRVFVQDRYFRWIVAFTSLRSTFLHSRDLELPS